jgi:hypothetical protein
VRPGLDCRRRIVRCAAHRGGIRARRNTRSFGVQPVNELALVDPDRRPDAKSGQDPAVDEPTDSLRAHPEAFRRFLDSQKGSVMDSRGHLSLMSSANAASTEPSCTIGRTCGVALLNSRLTLFDLHDVERMVGSVISGNKRLHLNPQQYESLTTYVIEEVWRCSLRYDPGRGTAFTTFAYETASRRVVDWLRLEFGRSKYQFHDRTIERTQPELISLDGIKSDRLDEAVATGTSDPADDWNPDLEGLLDCGDSQHARDLELLGLEPPRRAA